MPEKTNNAKLSINDESPENPANIHENQTTNDTAIPKVKTTTREISLDKLNDFSKFPTEKYTDKRLQALANEIEAYGLLNPIIVRPCPNTSDRFEIICGHNRVEAVKLLGWKRIKASIHENLSDEEALGMFFGDNLTQQNFNDWNFAQKFEAIRHIDRLVKESSKQGNRTDLKEEAKKDKTTSVHDGQKLDSEGKIQPTRARMAKMYGIGASTLGNYRSILKLDENVVNYLIQLLDEKRMSLAIAYRISKLKKEDIPAIIEFLKSSSGEFKGKDFTVSFKKLADTSVKSSEVLTLQQIQDSLNIVKT